MSEEYEVSEEITEVIDGEDYAMIRAEGTSVESPNEDGDFRVSDDRLGCIYLSRSFMRDLIKFASKYA